MFLSEQTDAQLNGQHWLVDGGDFPVLRYGTYAASLLRATAPCRVVALFARGFYLQAHDRLACFGGVEQLIPGPLVGLLEVPSGLDWRACGLVRGMVCRRGPCWLRIGGRILLRFGQAQSWQPEAMPERYADPAIVAAVVAHIAVLRQDDPSIAACQSVEAELLGWLRAVFGAAHPVPCPSVWLYRLIGAGTGLTPRGDDYVAGMMIALHGLRWGEAATLLGRAGLALAASTSHPISHAHLVAAAAGQGYEPLHRVLRDILLGDAASLAVRLGELDGIGHHSGWDMLDGMVAVLRAWLKPGDGMTYNVLT